MLDSNKNLVERIFAQMKDIGWTQKDLSEASGVSTAYINQLFKGAKSNPKKEIIASLCRAVGLCDDDQLDVRVSRFLANVEREEMPYEELADQSTKILEEIQRSNDVDESELAFLFLTTAKMHRKAQKYDLALHFIDQARDIYLTRRPDGYKYCETTFELAMILYDTAGFELAIQRLQRVELRLTLLGVGDLLLAKTMCFIAKAAVCIGNYELADKYAPKVKEMLTLVPTHDSEILLADCEFLNAEKLARNNQYPGAIEKYTLASSLYSMINRKNDSLKMMHNVADVYYLMGNLESAEKTAIETYSRKTTSSLTSRAFTANLLAKIFLAKREYDKAEGFADWVISNAEGIGITEVARAYTRKGQVLFSRDNDQDGLEAYFEEALIILGDKEPRYSAKIASQLCELHPRKGLKRLRK